jgi:hypothetical protein
MPINSFLYPGAKTTLAYEVANSCRFDDGSSDYLSRSTSTATNSKKYTLSLWVKRGNISSTQVFISYDSGGTAQETIRFSSDNTILWYHRTSGGTTYNLTTNQLFRDVSTWYHIVVAVDTTQGTSSNRVKLYVNGSQVTSFSTETYPAQNLDLFINNNNTVDIFRFQGDSGYFDGYATEVVFIDGTQLDPTSFGEFDEDSPNIWKPKSVLGLTFGTNGFYLDFENASSLGADVSGNSNNFTVNNLTSADQSTDTCTNNFATMNPIAPANISSASDGNLKILQSSSGGSVISTFGFSNGKWYWEVKLDSQVNYTQLAGVIKESKMESALLTSFNVGANDGGWGYFLQGNTDNGKAFHNNSASSVYTTMSAGNILSIAVDSDNGKIYFAVNGTYVNSGDPANGTGAVYTNLPTGENLFPAITNYVGDGSTATLLMNFGSPSFSISSGNSDANGYGNFEYAVPSGFYALNTKNLAEFG